MPKRKHDSLLEDPDWTHPDLENFKVDRADAKRLKKRLRARSSLTPRGQATAIGIKIVKNKLRTLNASLRSELLSTTLPYGWGDETIPTSKESEQLDCLYELREMLLTLEFHLGIDDATELPRFLPVKSSATLSRSNEYEDVLDADDRKFGEIALLGLVNRFSGAIFSDHHGLLLHFKSTKSSSPDLYIYYQSLDATHNFSGGTSIRSQGGMLTYTQGFGQSGSLRGAVGFTQQLSNVVRICPKLNVIVLAEAGKLDATKLVKPVLDLDWSCVTNNSNKDSRSNDITVFHKTKLDKHYTIDVRKLEIGKATVIEHTSLSGAKGCLVGCHILNTKAKNKIIGPFMKENKIGAVFGDTNLSTKAKSSLKFDFKTIESHDSVFGSQRFSFSNSAGDTMLDKLLVRTKVKPTIRRTTTTRSTTRTRKRTTTRKRRN